MTSQNGFLSIYEVGISLKIDFCIWILKADGLQCSPFHQHRKKHGVLQQNGFNVHLWKEWFHRVVITQDQRLPSLQNPQARIERVLYMEATSNLKDFPQLNPEMLRALLEQEATQMGEKYRDILDRAGSFSFTSLPPEVWTGSPVIGKLLKSMWEDYLNTPKTSLDKGFYDFELFDEVQKYSPYIEVLHIYQVDYPYPVVYPVPPAAAILSFANGASGSLTYHKSILSAAERLAQINQSNG